MLELSSNSEITNPSDENYHYYTMVKAALGLDSSIDDLKISHQSQQMGGYNTGTYTGTFHDDSGNVYVAIMVQVTAKP